MNRVFDALSGWSLEPAGPGDLFLDEALNIFLLVVVGLGFATSIQDAKPFEG